VFGEEISKTPTAKNPKTIDPPEEKAKMNVFGDEILPTLMEEDDIEEGDNDELMVIDDFSVTGLDSLLSGFISNEDEDEWYQDEFVDSPAVSKATLSQGSNPAKNSLHGRAPVSMKSIVASALRCEKSPLGQCISNVTGLVNTCHFCGK